MYSYEIMRQKALQMASALTKEEKKRIKKLEQESERLSQDIKKAHPYLSKRISLKLLWEYDPMFWSDCGHNEEFNGAVEEWLIDKDFLGRINKKSREKYLHSVVRAGRK